MSLDSSQRHFRELLRTHRLRRGVTQRQLADLSTVSIRAIRDLELGHAHRPRRDTVRLIADGLRLSIRERHDFEEAAARITALNRLRTMFGNQRPEVDLADREPILGRDLEVTVLADLVGSSGQRLVNVTGLGGVGKSRTAQEVAAVLSEQRDLSVLWYPSAGPVVPQSPGAAVGPAEHGGPAERMVGDVAALIGNQPTLLVLDDCGHDADRIRVDRAVALLRACPRLSVLCTSRVPLGVPGERVFPLAPLPLAVPAAGPDALAASRMPAVQLLVRCVERVQLSFTVTTENAAVLAEICAYLDGIPGAIEEISSYFLVYDSQTLLKELSNGFMEFVTANLPWLRAVVIETLAHLSAADAAALAVLGDLTDAWSVDDLATLSGAPTVEAARTVRRLLVLGLIRSVGDADKALFRTLRILQSHLRP